MLCDKRRTAQNTADWESATSSVTLIPVRDFGAPSHVAIGLDSSAIEPIDSWRAERSALIFADLPFGEGVLRFGGNRFSDLVVVPIPSGIIQQIDALLSREIFRGVCLD